MLTAAPYLPGVALGKRQSGRSSGVEHNLAKVGVEGSNPFARSNIFKPVVKLTIFAGAAPELLRRCAPAVSSNAMGKLSGIINAADVFVEGFRPVDHARRRTSACASDPL